MKKAWLIMAAILYLTICGTAALVANRTKQMAEEQAEYAVQSANVSKEHAMSLANDYRKQYQDALLEIAELKAENERLSQQIEDLTRAVEETTFALDEVCYATNWKSLGEFKLTYYCNCEKCCGKWANGRTATGTIPEEGRTVAVDPNVIPLGSTLEIDGNIYVAEDTGVHGRVIDVFVTEHERALQLGVKRAEVKRGI